MNIARKLFFLVSVVWGIITILFILFRIIIDPSQMLAGQRVDEQTLVNIQKELGLDLPLYEQYWIYLNDLSPIGYIKNYHSGIPLIGSWGFKLPFLGVSIFYKETVWNLFLNHMNATLLLATISVLIAFGSAYYIGKYLYLKNQQNLYKICLQITKIGIATPSFILSILLLWIFSLQLNLLPISGYFIQINPWTLSKEWNLSYLLLPVIASSLRPFAIFLQMIIQLLEQENQKDYVKTAQAKGLNRIQIYEQHIWGNLMPTLISLFFNWWASLLAGAFFIEYIFDYPGIGKLLIEAILQNDYPMVSGLCLISALIFLFLNTINDWIVMKLKVH